MDAAKGQKRSSAINELVKHSGLIENPKIKEYITRKKAAKQEAKLEKQRRATGIHRKLDVEMDSESDAEEQQMQSESEQEQEQVKAVAKVKAKKKVGKLTQKKIKK